LGELNNKHLKTNAWGSNYEKNTADSQLSRKLKEIISNPNSEITEAEEKKIFYLSF